jgi:ABC-type polysaccharide/polyol phosphate export permease
LFLDENTFVIYDYSAAITIAFVVTWCCCLTYIEVLRVLLYSCCDPYYALQLPFLLVPCLLVDLLLVLVIGLVTFLQRDVTVPIIQVLHGSVFWLTGIITQSSGDIPGIVDPAVIVTSER